MDSIETLKHNDWIEPCEGPWGSMIVLAPKPHQEHITDIKDFIWRMCVSYRKLNGVTKPFAYPIPRCDDAVDNLGICVGDKIYIISLDAKQGYHQVKVREVDREKLAFFSPDHTKWTFKVMPFGPTNAPAFYTCMMHDMQIDWDKLFIISIGTLPEFKGKSVTKRDNNCISIGEITIMIGSKVIIDDILLFSTHLGALLIYLECICKVFQKFRVSFQLKKCEFLKERVEYVGHDMTSHQTATALLSQNLI